MNDLKFKNFDITETKADASGNLIITAYGAVFGNIDAYGDIIEKGAFADTLIERKDRIAFCYQHDIFNPVGKINEIKEDDIGLYLKVMISAADMDIQTKIKEGILKELSIGYKTMQERKEERNGQEVNILLAVKLFEVSLVTIAANPLAVVESMKSEIEKQDYIKKEIDRLLAIVRNDKIAFEIEKLKSLIFSAPAGDTPEPQKSGDNKSNALVFDSNFFINKLNN